MTAPERREPPRGDADRTASRDRDDLGPVLAIASTAYRRFEDGPRALAPRGSGRAFPYDRRGSQARRRPALRDAVARLGVRIIPGCFRTPSQRTSPVTRYPGCRQAPALSGGSRE